MKEILIYMIEAGLCLSVFLIIYRFFLRSTTFFRFNRIFLMVGLFISFIIPVLDFDYNVVTVNPPTVVTAVDINQTMPVISNVSQVDVKYTSESSPLITSENQNNILIKMNDIWTVLFAIYLLGILLLVGRNIIAHFSLLRLYLGGTKTKEEGYTLIDSPQIKTPFTVFNLIFANMGRMSEESRSSILKHEVVHLRQLHWVDLMFGELALILQWFNPVAWAYLFTLKENHEFLADKGVLAQGVSPALYRAILVNERFDGKLFNFVNTFKYAGSLGRLAMMKKSKSSAWRRMLALVIIPIFGGVLWLSAEPNYIIINLDRFSFKIIDKVNMVDKDGYPIENGVSTQDILGIAKLASYENLIPSSLRDKKIKLYSKTGKDGTLVVETLKGGAHDGISNADMINKISGLEDVIILINGDASSLEDLKEIALKDIDFISYIYNDRMLSQTADEITVSMLSDHGGNLPTVIKTDDINIAGCPDIIEYVYNMDGAIVIVNGRKSNMNNFKNIRPGNINVLTVFTKSRLVSQYGGNNESGVVIVQTNG